MERERTLTALPQEQCGLRYRVPERRLIRSTNDIATKLAMSRIFSRCRNVESKAAFYGCRWMFVESGCLLSKAIE
jgi:hypothetical protein